MPAKTFRLLERPERKLRNVPKKTSIKMARNSGLGDVTFFYDLEGNIFYSRLSNAGENVWSVNLGKASETTEKEVALVYNLRKYVYIGNLKKDPRKSGNMDEWKQQKGQMVFRAVLNEAMKIAKLKKLDVKISAENEKLANYYKSFGFSFKNGSLEGILYIFKNPEKK